MISSQRVNMKTAVSDLSVHGYVNMLSFEPCSQWSEVEAVLRKRGLVHDNECLHVTAGIYSTG